MPRVVDEVGDRARHVRRQPLPCAKGTVASSPPAQMATGTTMLATSNPHGATIAKPSSRAPITPCAPARCIISVSHTARSAVRAASSEGVSKAPKPAATSSTPAAVMGRKYISLNAP